MSIAPWRWALALLAAAAPARAQDPGLAELGVPPGAVAGPVGDSARDRYALPVGRIDGAGGGIEALEGRVVRATWVLPPDVSSTAEVLAATRARLVALGYTVVWDCVTQACGGFDYRFAVEVMPAPAMRMDVADFGQITARRGAGAVSVLVSRSLGAVHGQIVLVDPSAAPAPLAAPLAPAPAPDDLRARLLADGHVVLDGVAFDSAGAGLAATSAASLDRIAAMLAGDPALAVAIVGHSDTQGALEANIALSRQRATSVRDALVARGIAPDRLEAQGAGWLAPRASNATEQGRALNRRVELVRR